MPVAPVTRTLSMLFLSPPDRTSSTRSTSMRPCFSADSLTGLYETELVRNAGPGRASTSSNSPLSNGSTDSTTAASSTNSAASRQRSSKTSTTVRPTPATTPSTAHTVEHTPTRPHTRVDASAAPSCSVAVLDPADRCQIRGFDCVGNRVERCLDLTDVHHAVGPRDRDRAERVDPASLNEFSPSRSRRGVLGRNNAGG